MGCLKLKREHITCYPMRIISRARLKECWIRYPDAEQPLLAWYREVEREDWDQPARVKDKYGSASFVGERVVFNIGGNKYRLIVWINYPFRVVYVRFVGTHKEYDKINVEEI